MESYFDVKTVDQARDILFKAWKVKPLDIEEVHITAAAGRVLARDILACEDVPPFARSTVDGYAVMAKDTFGATEALPAILEIVEDIRMGAIAEKNLLSGQAARIPTGGSLPCGADACVMIEHTDLLDDRIVLVKKPVAPGENVIHKGEDVTSGETLLLTGRVLRAFEIGALAALGHVTVPVFRRPRVAILSTGDEIVPPDKIPGPGQIRDINTYSLAASALSCGAIPITLGISSDTYEDVRQPLEEALDTADLLVVSGGSSVGTRDVVVQVISDLGPPGVLVHGVALKPGKPTILGICRDKPVFGLPGHPVSALTVFSLFVKPAVVRLYEKSSASTAHNTRPGSETAFDLHFDFLSREKTVMARLSRNISSAPGREDHIRVRLRLENGEFWADPVLGKSGLISTLLKSHGEVVIPLEYEGLKAGSLVEVRLT